ncbi:MAG: helix-turn-helix domain-containing protein [Verrucomicrobiales bacterium]|nr:helix-turn-helix domain-containing protein [Verrucomicrobiales bacterium]
MSFSQPVLHRFQFRGYDPDRLREVINGADLDHVILAPTTCSANVDQWQSDALSIARGFYDFPVFVRGQFARGQLCIGMSRGKVEPTWVNGAHLSQSSLQVYAEAAEMTYRAGPSAEWCAITVSRELLQDAALQHLGLELNLPVSGMRNYTLPPSSIDRLISRIASAQQPTSPSKEDPLWHQNQILRLTVEALAAADPENAKTIELRNKRRLEVIHRTDAEIRRLIKNGSGYSSHQLCRALGLSERNLQIHFKESLGMSPKSWFRHLAFNEVRSALIRKPKRPGMVTKIAMDHGFEHLGRFSRDYRKLFGESPSETARKSTLRSH